MSFRSNSTRSVYSRTRPNARRGAAPQVSTVVWMPASRQRWNSAATNRARGGGSPPPHATRVAVVRLVLLDLAKDLVDRVLLSQDPQRPRPADLDALGATVAQVPIDPDAPLGVERHHRLLPT